MEAGNRRSVRCSRRDALRLLGLGVGVGASLAVDTLEAAVWQRPAAPSPVVFPDGAIIRTVLQDLNPSALTGPILTHEHLSMSTAFMSRFRALGRAGGPPPAVAPLLTENLEAMVEEVRATRADGVACIVDAGSGHGRSIDFLKQLSTRSGMPIVAAGGYFLEPFYPASVNDLSEDQLVGRLVRDAAAERWGAMGELGSEAAFTPLQRKVFRAIARAHLQTNLPIFTHTSGGLLALDQLDFFESVGVKPQSLMIGHLSRLNEPNVDVHKSIASRGAFVGFDQVGRGAADANQVTMVRALVEAGHADHILLSADFGSNDAEYHHRGGAGFARTMTVFVPMLRKAGIDDATIRKLTVDNPRRFLAFVPRTS